MTGRAEPCSVHRIDVHRIDRAGRPAQRTGDLRLAVLALATWLGGLAGSLLPVEVGRVLALLLATGGMLGWGGIEVVGGRGLARRTRRVGPYPTWGESKLRMVAAGSLLAGAAVGAGVLRVAAMTEGPVARLAADRAVASVEVVVTSDPVRYTSPASFGGAPRPVEVVAARTAWVQARGRMERTAVPVQLVRNVSPAPPGSARGAPGDPAVPSSSWAAVGERLRVSGRLAPARDPRRYAARMTVTGTPALASRAPVVLRAAERLRGGLVAATHGLPSEPAGLLPGLVMGNTSGLSQQLLADFRTSGLTHLTAVSGANVAIVVGAVVFVAGWTRLPRRPRVGLALLAVVGFVILVRPDPSVLRAATMGTVGLLGVWSGRPAAAIPALAGAIVVLVLVDPGLARSYGFILSVLATAGLIALGSRWAGILERWWPRPLAEAVAVPMAAQVAVAPVIVLISGQVSLAAVPANVAVAPAVAPATVLGVVSALVAPLSPGVAHLLATVAMLPTGWIVLVAHQSARVPGASLSWWSGAGGAVGLAFGLGLLLAVGYAVTRRAGPGLTRRRAVRSTGRASRRPGSRLRPERGDRRRVPTAVLGVVAVLLAAGWVVAGRPLHPPASRWPPPGWVMVACDVGQGDALVLAAGPGRAVLVDAGPDDDRVDRCLRMLGVVELPMIVLTHFHADHVGGLAGAVRGRRVGRIVVSPLAEPSGQVRRVADTARDRGIPVLPAPIGGTVRDGGLTWQFLEPTRLIPGDHARGEESAPNNASLVLIAESAGVRLLLTGDIEPEAQRQLLADGVLGRVDVLKVAHHGSAYQDQRLLTGLGARVAIVSVGAGNEYGHPAPSTLRALQASGIRLLRTDTDGALAVLGPAERLRVARSGRR